MAARPELAPSPPLVQTYELEPISDVHLRGVASADVMKPSSGGRDSLVTLAAIGLLIVAIVGFFAFLIWELTDEHPIVDLRIFRHRGFSTACFAMTLAFAGMFSANVLVPLVMTMPRSWPG